MNFINNKGRASLIIAILLAGSLSIGGAIVTNDHPNEKHKEEKNEITTEIRNNIKEKNNDKNKEVTYNNALPKTIISEINNYKEKDRIIDKIKEEQALNKQNKSYAQIKSLSDEEEKEEKSKDKISNESEENITNSKAEPTIEAKMEKNNDTLSDGFERYVLYDIPMPVEHQRYLYNLCKEKDLDYIKTLAILKHESQFNANLVHTNKNGTKDYGYMQVNSCNHETFSKELGTPIDPLNPYINLEWGTHELQKLKKLYSGQGLTGRDLFEAVQSGYNKGVYGFKKYGKAERYIKRTDRELKWLADKLNL